MKTKAMMSDPDFQKLLALVLNDLAIRRTMLERDAELEQLDDQIQQLQRDYNHYREFCNPNFNFDSQKYYQGPSMGLPKFP